MRVLDPVEILQLVNIKLTIILTETDGAYGRLTHV